MSIAVLTLSTALLCFQGACHPALVGKDTPVGTFPLTKRIVQAEGYGGDVLQFAESEEYVFAVHRVWLGNPAQKRLQRLASKNPADRRGVSGGCVNVEPAVYDLLQAATQLVITN